MGPGGRVRLDEEERCIGWIDDEEDDEEDEIDTTYRPGGPLDPGKFLSTRLERRRAQKQEKDASD